MSIEAYRLSLQQTRLWPWQSRYPTLRHQSAVRLNGDLDGTRFRRALYGVVERHEILFTTYQRLAAGECPLQTLSQSCSPEWRAVDLTACSPIEQQMECVRIFQQQGEAEFDLAAGPSTRFILIRLSSRTHQLLTSVPSLNGDSATLSSLVEEAIRAYTIDATAEPCSTRISPNGSGIWRTPAIHERRRAYGIGGSNSLAEDHR
jgi:hypothetical protein